MIQLDNLTRKIAYQFNDPELLKQALTHRSASQSHNERLEFLGDSILGFVIAKYLYEKFPDAAEGQLSRLRSHLVKGKTLARLAQQIELGEFLELGGGELKSGGHRRDSILADAFEAVVGAIYLDGGLDSVEQCVEKLYGNLLENLSLDHADKDPKTQLQELLQARKQMLPDYQVVSISGEAHQQIFHVQCLIEALAIQTEGRGKSRRKAEQQAAEQALFLLEKQ